MKIIQKSLGDRSVPCLKSDDPYLEIELMPAELLTYATAQKTLVQIDAASREFSARFVPREVLQYAESLRAQLGEMRELEKLHAEVSSKYDRERSAAMNRLASVLYEELRPAFGTEARGVLRKTLKWRQYESHFADPKRAPNHGQVRARIEQFRTLTEEAQNIFKS